MNYKDIVQNDRNDDILLSKPQYLAKIKTPFSNIITPKVLEDYTLIIDHLSKNNFIHIFNRENLEHLGSFGQIGKGPNEISRLGCISLGIENNIYLTDFGKLTIFKYSIDDYFKEKEIKSTIVHQYNNENIFLDFDYLNDQKIIGLRAKVGKVKGYTEVVSRYDLIKNEMIDYENKVLSLKDDNFLRSSIALNSDHKILIRAFKNVDLISCYDLEGNLQFNIKGLDWQNNEGNRKGYYFDVEIEDNFIIASYLNNDKFGFDSFNNPIPKFPNQLLIFDLTGNYLKTIKTNSPFYSFTVDIDNNRIYFNTEPVNEESLEIYKFDFEEI